MAARRSVANVGSALDFNSEPTVIPGKQDEEGENYEGRPRTMGIMVSVRRRCDQNGQLMASGLPANGPTSSLRFMSGASPTVALDRGGLATGTENDADGDIHESENPASVVRDDTDSRTHTEPPTPSPSRNQPTYATNVGKSGPADLTKREAFLFRLWVQRLSLSV